MNEPEKTRCEDYSRMLFGKALKKGEFEEIVKASASFADFRIRVVHRCSARNEHSKQIAARWQSTVARPEPVPDANILLHMLESLSQKQLDMERKLREASADLLARLQVLDAAATSHAAWRSQLEEIRGQIAVIRGNLARSEDIPSHRGSPK
jgi:hypothetical protein